ncbi:hypothetical protein [Erythrobacter sp. YT30]|uniref:hypothetical protein n=1 Tax=Erythrobacter sp. YT30 TaxID=1735012 RepID=UPI00076CF6C6|nr:hypothetical protein [Erythrobacter sp. YT30]KWV92040.1 hypothetical protein AUC45_12880 [Erythrobacter sp. YT30]
MSEVLQSSAALSASSDILREVLDPSYNLAIWERPSNGAYENLLSDDLRDVRFQTTPTQLRECLQEKLGDAG